MTLRSQAVAGVKWMAASTALIVGLQLAQIAVLGRLVAPEDFGLMAMVLVVMGFAQAFADMGVSNAIIHRQDTTPEQLSSLYWLNLLAGMAVFLLVNAATPFIVQFYREPRVADLLLFSSLAFVVTPFGQQFEALLRKQLKFKTVSIIETLCILAGVLFSIALAWLGYGVLALVFGQLLNATLRSISLTAIGWRNWRPELHFRREDLRGYLRFGLYQMGARTVNYFSLQLDLLLVGSLLGAQSLGYYSMAKNLVMQPVARINPILNRVAFPVFATVQDDTDRLKHGFMKVRSILTLVNAPLLLGVAAIAPTFVLVLLGKNWMPTVPLIQLLAPVALLRAIGNPVGSLLLAKGRPGLGLQWNLLVLITQVPAIWIGSRASGMIGVAQALLALHLLYLVAEYFFLTRALLGPCLRLHLASLRQGVVTSLGMIAAIFVLSRFLKAEPLDTFLLQLAVGASSYIALNGLLYREETKSLLASLRGARA